MKLQEKIVLFSLLGFVVAYYFLSKPYQSFKEQRTVPGITYPDIKDFQYCLIFTPIIILARFVCEHFIFFPFARLLILREDDWSEETFIRRCHRVAETGFNLFYYIFSSYYGYKILKDQVWTPKWLFGHGDITLCYKDIFEHDVSDLKIYYMLELSFTLCLLFFTVIVIKHGKDFFEYTIHHLTTIFLIVFSYMFGLVRVGSLVLLLHDLTDVFFYLYYFFL